ncbi:uncharacterized protein LOC134827003 [Culicoides brevitarsis]|uniref:uncharacterized protein LOC134827003 n=1 Tax=Culicoides brevitarsis TaxID=469753 RepID=UPI00307B851B
MKKLLLLGILVILAKNSFAQDDEEGNESEQIEIEDPEGNVEDPDEDEKEKPLHKGCRGCRPMNYLKKFPCHDLEGVWFYTAIYDELNPGPHKNCLQIEFKFVNCSTFDVTLCHQDEAGEAKCMIGATFVSVDHVSPTGHGMVFIPDLPIKYDVYLLDIVKDEYAIFYSCKKYDDDTQFEEYFILTRKGVIYENDGSKWTQILAQNGLDASKMSLYKQGKGCNYKLEPSF